MSPIEIYLLIGMLITLASATAAKRKGAAVGYEKLLSEGKHAEAEIMVVVAFIVGAIAWPVIVAIAIAISTTQGKR